MLFFFGSTVRGVRAAYEHLDYFPSRSSRRQADMVVGLVFAGFSIYCNRHCLPNLFRLWVVILTLLFSDGSTHNACASAYKLLFLARRIRKLWLSGWLHESCVYIFFLTVIEAICKTDRKFLSFLYPIQFIAQVFYHFVISFTWLFPLDIHNTNTAWNCKLMHGERIIWTKSVVHDIQSQFVVYYSRSFLEFILTFVRFNIQVAVI